MTTRDVSGMDVVDLYVLGSPCQSYSYLGNRKGATDGRGLLIFKGLDYIKIKKPTYFILEDVKGFYTVSEGTVFRKVMAMLNSLESYNVSVKTLNTKDYGVPQSRQRMYIVGVPRDEAFSFPNPVPCPSIETFLETNVPEVTCFTPATLKSLQCYKEKIPTLDTLCHIIDLSVTKNYVRRGQQGVCPCLRISSNRFYVTTRRRYLRECLRLQRTAR